MGKVKPVQLPIRLRDGHKTDVRTQFAALCFRMRKNSVQVCLVTTRRTGRWIVPRGWPMHKQTPAMAAATEAYEEAGLSGDTFDRCLGVYSYTKPLDGAPTSVIVMVYPVLVRNVHSEWPEKDQRRRKWFSLKKAARKLSEPELQRIVATFDPGTALR